MADEDTFPFDDDEVSDEGDKAPEKENQSFAALRKAHNREEKARKALEKEVEELRTFKTGIVEVQREAAINSVFTEVGLNPKHAELFKAVNKDLEVDSISRDAVAAFAAEYQLVTNSGEAVEAPESAPSGFTPVTTGTAAPSQKHDAEWIRDQLRAGNLDEVAAAMKAGRVQRESVPWAKYQG